MPFVQLNPAADVTSGVVRLITLIIMTHASDMSWCTYKHIRRTARNRLKCTSTTPSYPPLVLVHARHDVEDGHGEDEHGADEDDHEEAVDDLREHAPLVLDVVPFDALAHLRADLSQMQQDLLDHRQVLALRDQHLQLVVHAVQTVPAAASAGGGAADTAVVDARRDSLVLPPPAVGRRYLAQVQALGPVRVEDA